MFRSRPFLVFLALGCALRLWAQGGSAIITLVMPPPGDAGFAALQSGAALAEGASAAYYNPAALAELQRSTGSSVGLSQSEQDLLPTLGLPDLRQRFWAADYVAADPAAGADLGVGFFRNHVDFGWNTDANGRSFSSWEDVWGLAIGVRLGLPISVGVSAKFIDSHLYQGNSDPNSPNARSWAFDAGILAMPRWRAPVAWKLPLTVAPSAAFTLANLGPDVFYAEAELADPIPRTFTVATGLSANVGDLVSVTGHWQADVEWTWRSDRFAPVYNRGLSGRLFFMEWGRSYLRDRVGQRKELHESEALVLDPLAWAHAIALIKSWRSPGAPAAGGRGNLLGTWNLGGGRISLRPRLVLGRHNIIARGEGAREGQKSLYLSLSL